MLYTLISTNCYCSKSLELCDNVENWIQLLDRKFVFKCEAQTQKQLNPYLCLKHMRICHNSNSIRSAWDERYYLLHKRDTEAYQDQSTYPESLRMQMGKTDPRSAWGQSQGFCRLYYIMPQNNSANHIIGKSLFKKETVLKQLSIVFISRHLSRFFAYNADWKY